jgi:group I intron endonuclease
MTFRGLIYMYRNKVNGKAYIGQTVQPMSHRRRDHTCAARNANKKGHNSVFQKAIRKYGIENFEETLICTALSRETLNDLEVYFIQFFDTMNREKGYNLTSGGLVTNHTEETKRKISEASKRLWANKNHRQRMSESGKNNWIYLQTPEARAKNLESKRGKIYTLNDKQKEGLKLGIQVSKKPVICIKDDGSIQRFESARDAAKYFNISYQNIYHACRKHIQKCGNMIWEYVQE